MIYATGGKNPRAATVHLREPRSTIHSVRKKQDNFYRIAFWGTYTNIPLVSSSPGKIILILNLNCYVFRITASCVIKVAMQLCDNFLYLWRVCERKRSRRHDVLEDVLVEEDGITYRDEEELHNGNTATSVKTSRKDSLATGVHENPTRHPTTESAEDQPGGSRVTSVIMMYSPDIPSIDEQHGAETVNSIPGTDIGNYYLRIDTEETVKCVVSSVLFCAVVVLIVLVALLKNPGM